MSDAALVLGNGTLRFSALAAGDGPVVLMLHGFPDTPHSFDAQITAFGAAGYRAIAPTMRGYEQSSQPDDGDYHAIRMAEDVVAWAAQLGGGPVHLVGHDWGANIAYAAASLAPELFRSLTALAVPHPMRFGEAYAQSEEQQRRSAYVLAFQAPGFEAELVADNGAYLEGLWRAWSPGWAVPSALLDAMKAAFRAPGVAQAALEYYRQAFDVVSEAGQASAALFARPITVPTLGLCGEQDGCIPAEIFTGAMQATDFPAGLRVEIVAGAGHFLQSEQPDRMNALMLDWFAAHQR